MTAPKKSLGQNFLVDRNIAAKIVREFAPGPGDLVVEIGPGQGALTDLLVDSGCRLVAIELDPRMVELIAQRHGDRVEVIAQDVLTVDFTELARKHGAHRLRVIGNIPYYITSPIIFHLIDHRAVVGDAALMMQREVADRLVARTRTKDYGILSVAVQTYSEPRSLMTVPPTCFFPPPKVTSRVVSLRFRDVDGIVGLERVHRSLLRAAFNQRRKTLRNSLAAVIPDQQQRERIFAEAGVQSGARAEELEIGDFVRLARAAHAANSKGRPATS